MRATEALSRIRAELVSSQSGRDSYLSEVLDEETTAGVAMYARAANLDLLRSRIANILLDAG